MCRILRPLWRGLVHHLSASPNRNPVSAEITSYKPVTYLARDVKFVVGERKITSEWPTICPTLVIISPNPVSGPDRRELHRTF